MKERWVSHISRGSFARFQQHNGIALDTQKQQLDDCSLGKIILAFRDIK